MNCRPGDLAVIVSDEPGFPENIGKFVTVLDRQGARGDEWRVEAHSPLMALCDTTGRDELGYPGEALWIPDSDLRPIRDPGDSAVDEMLLLVGSPTKETA